MENFPPDLWNIIWKYKTDMELLEESPTPEANTVMSCDFHFPLLQQDLFDSDTFLLHRYTELLFGDCNDDTLTHYIKNYVNMPLVMLHQYIKALQIYHKRLAVWGIPDTGRVPENWAETTAQIVQDYCDNRDRELYTRRLVKLLRNSKTRRLLL